MSPKCTSVELATLTKALYYITGRVHTCSGREPDSMLIHRMPVLRTYYYRYLAIVFLPSLAVRWVVAPDPLRQRPAKINTCHLWLRDMLTFGSSPCMPRGGGYIRWERCQPCRHYIYDQCFWNLYTAAATCINGYGIMSKNVASGSGAIENI